MKSQVNGLLKVAEGVLTDYRLTYPHDERDVVRDLERLTRLTKERGIGVYLLDLPALDGSLLRGLESGRLILDGALSKKASSRILVPKLFRGLWLRIFSSDGNLLEDADPNAIFFLRQLLSLGKKLEVECSAARKQTVLKEYYHVEQSARAPTFSWGNNELGSDDSCSFDDLIDRRSTTGGDGQLDFQELNLDRKDDHHKLRDVLRRLQRNFDSFSQAIGTFNAEEFLLSVQQRSDSLGFRHGPGAVSDLTSKEFKYDFPTWSDKLGTVFPYRRFGTLETPLTLNQSEEDILQVFRDEAQYELFWNPKKGTNGQGEAGFDGILSHPGFLESRVARMGVHFGLPMEHDGTVHNSAVCASALARLRSPSKHEPFSRLMAVPKTAKGPRLIASEPTSYQWCQQLILKFLEQRLSGLFGTNFVSFKNQGLSQRLVSKASIDRSLATVDLSSASDRLTCWVIERAFRRNQSLLKALHATRTRWVKDTVDVQSPPNYFVLKKFASQGTAVTFPVQTIIFLIIALTASGFEADGPEDFVCNQRFSKKLGRLSDKVRVFGDDIIIPRHGYDQLCLLLHALGLRVNQDKSFVLGHFRESCGMDSFKGHNVTPIKTKVIVATGPQSRQSLIDYANNLHKAGLWYAAKTVESMIPGWVVSNLPVIGIGFGGVGRTSFCGSQRDHLRKRWNPRYQRYEDRVYAVISRSKRKSTNTLSGVLQYITEAPRPVDKWVHGIPGRPKTSDGLKWEFPHCLAISECQLG